VPEAPKTDDDIPAYWAALGLPGLADIHVHFMPESVLAKVRHFFDHADDSYGMAWPLHYRQDEPQRLALARQFGLRAIPSLCYPHKPGMAVWLNQWCAEFAGRVPDAVHSATFYPEDGVTEYVRAALDEGARLFKVHVQVGVFSPDDTALDGAWGLLEDAGVPVVLHAGSAPAAGRFTGPGAVAQVLRRFPRLALVIAHLGMNEYHAFADLADTYRNVHLDTTMAGTDFTNRFAPLPADYLPRLADLGSRVVLGADFPNIPYPYAHQLVALDRLGLGDEWLRAVLWDNGARLMGLPAR
jgi:predicted TIM-barrel fold metal-dependent hydrolase